MKNKETELKYKIDKLPDKLDEELEIDQFYFDGAKRMDILQKIFPEVDMNIIHTFRVRKIRFDNALTYIITLKSRAISLTRDEFEKETDKETFDRLILNNVDSEIKKNRYVTSHDGYRFEFDEYLNLKEKLYTCEVELDSEETLADDKKKIEDILKNTFGLNAEDVTFDNRYKNSNLHKYF